MHGPPPRETHLALAEEHYSDVRANVWFNGLDNRDRGRFQIAVKLPLLYPLGRSKETPEVVCPGTEPGLLLSTRTAPPSPPTESSPPTAAIDPFKGHSVPA